MRENSCASHNVFINFLKLKSKVREITTNLDGPNPIWF